jgi:hypothetical protein
MAVRPATLWETADSSVVELPPADHDLPWIIRVDGDRRLVRRVPEDVASAAIDVDLNAPKPVALDHRGK